MARKKREYDVLLGVTISKIVTVRAHSMKEARGVIYNAIPEEDQLGGDLLSESVGSEFVIDVVRAGEAWHFDRKSHDESSDSGTRTTAVNPTEETTMTETCSICGERSNDLTRGSDGTTACADCMTEADREPSDSETGEH